ncbi:MAG TPA: DNA starvation/stationary phase protection protein Dps [Anaerolineales bacterium]|nr:DNA starvation/stationary phase protection protein Dps [Anaerolineales bacterium]
MAVKTNHQAGTKVKTSHDLPRDTREKMIRLLNTQLADTFDLFSQTKQAHWNVKGMQFYTLHELYDELAEGLLGYVDVIAERAVILGGAATGTVRMAASSSRLDEFSAEPINSQGSIEELVKRYAALAATTRKGIDTADEAGDMDTSDLLIDVSRFLDKSLWFLEAHIQL